MSIKTIICKMKGHELTFAVEVSFTGATYYYCKKCNIVMPVQVVQ